MVKLKAVIKIALTFVVAVMFFSASAYAINRKALLTDGK